MRKHRITLYPVRDENPVPQSFMHGEGEAQQRRDPSTKRVDHPGRIAVTRLSWLTSAVIARGRSEARTQHGAGRHHAGLKITPERHHQLAGPPVAGLADALLAAAGAAVVRCAGEPEIAADLAAIVE